MRTAFRTGAVLMGFVLVVLALAGIESGPTASGLHLRRVASVGRIGQLFVLLTVPGEEDPDFVAAQKVYLEGKMDQAIQLATKTIQRDPKHSGAFNTRACALHSLGRYKEALPDFDRALELNQSDPLIYANRGRTLYSLQKFDAALKDFDTSVKLDPKSDDNIRWRGHANGALGKSAESLADFQQAVALKPIALNHAMVSRGFRMLGKLQEAVKAADTALGLDPKNSDAFRERARAYISLRSFSEAEADLATLLKRRRTFRTTRPIWTSTPIGPWRGRLSKWSPPFTAI